MPKKKDSRHMRKIIREYNKSMNKRKKYLYLNEEGWGVRDY